MNKYFKVNSNVVNGTTNCTWNVTKERLQIIEELAEKQIFKVIINGKNAFDTHISICSSYRHEIMELTENV